MFLTQIVKSAGDTTASSISLSIYAYEALKKSNMIMMQEILTNPRYSWISSKSGSLITH